MTKDNQQAIYKHCRGYELETIVDKSSKRSVRVVILGPPSYQPGTLTTRPLSLL